MNNIQWKTITFNQLSTIELYRLIQLRVAVFVVEQTCFYQELDDKDHDKETQHVLGYRDQELVAYARLLAPDVSYPDQVSIGRVIVSTSARGIKLGDRLMEQCLTQCAKHWPGRAIKISAQQHLQRYYNRHGFVTASEMYLEDDIPHVAMCAKGSSVTTP